MIAHGEPGAIAGNDRGAPTCVLIGEETLLRQCGEILRRRGWAILAVVTPRADIAAWANAADIAVLDTPAALGGAGIAPIDFLFSITNLTVLPEAVLALARRGAINFHDGPLPDYAGLNTPSWALRNGETVHGITWHEMTAGVDRGDILLRRAVEIDPADTALTLNAKCFAAGMESFEDLLTALSDGTQRPEQQTAAAHHYYGRKDRPEAAGLIDWSLSADVIDRQIRALQFGEHFNPLGTAKAAIHDRLLILTAATPVWTESRDVPGTITRIDANRITVATGTTDLAILAVGSATGDRMTISDAVDHFQLFVGSRFKSVDPAMRAWIGTTDVTVAAHESFWRARLARSVPVDLPRIDRTVPIPPAHAHLDQPLPAAARGVGVNQLVAAALAYFARLTDRSDITLGYANPILIAQTHDPLGCFAAQLPLQVSFAFDTTFAALSGLVAADVCEMHRQIGFCTDLIARDPALRSGGWPLPVAVVVADRLEHAHALPGSDLTLAVQSDGAACRWHYAPGRIPDATIEAMHGELTNLLSAALADPERWIADLPLLATTEQDRIVRDWNATAAPWREDACIHDLIAEQAARTPDAIAIVCKGRTLSYDELDRRANQLARRLRTLGVGADTLVGLFVDRTVDLPVAMLAIHKAGGAYVPLDPEYPASRIAYMIADARMPVLLTTGHVRDQVPETPAKIVVIDTEWPSIAGESDAPLDPVATPDSLAYVIYTSGSTGQPKGVMVEHRNVVNFFAGMDATIAAPGTWLAVTSLSFDISVLELCWTLARGFKVVIQSGDLAAAAATQPDRAPIDFSLFYFSSDSEGDAEGKYRLLLEGARFADSHGFAAVWTPERHFHAFGGLYPNPSVTSAAIAAVTKRVQIRAGSVVLPLHHPARVAEEWAMVDNLSGGRVGISFAAGWQPDDFVLQPNNFADAKQAMLRNIDLVRRLWRGEAVELPGALGKPVAVRTMPRPVQAELPFWLTSAGNIASFEAAGRMGASILTHLLGQTFDELAMKIAAYRRAWQEAGHAGQGSATLMLHSFVGPDADSVRETVRAPLIAYLRSSASLIKQYAWSFPAFKRKPGMEQAGDVDLDGLDAAEFDALLDYAFDRYFRDAGLFGTPAQCRAIVERVRAIGVDEIACLIDFGVAAQTVLDHLPWLDAVRAETAALDADAESIAGLMLQHDVTHLQCTPSMARMMVDSGTAAAAFRPLRHLLIGGEAFPPALATDLLALTDGKITNMYGPTETTIWSATSVVAAGTKSIPVGRPLANQEIFILDRRGAIMPPGVPGEIVIGGLGVTRGYLNHEALTAERFTPDPLHAGRRVYHTGDLGRFRDDGVIEFLGRFDHQVKVRGHRIELGEIEAALTALAGVAQAIVVAREDKPGDTRLCAYLVAEGGSAPNPNDLRAALRVSLPDFMVPAHVQLLAALPRTPNGKIDRAALPAPSSGTDDDRAEAFVAPALGVEEQVAAIWRDILKLPQVGVHDNFFDLGGHSLLAVQLHRRLRTDLSRAVSITDVFRFPTVAAFAAHLSGSSEADAAGVAEDVRNRALGRRAALGRRRPMVGQTANSDGG